MADDLLALADWRRRVSELYERVRSNPDPGMAWTEWVEVRNELFRSHPQSPIPEPGRADFEGVGYFDHDPSFRVMGFVTNAPVKRYNIETSGEGTLSFTRFAIVTFALRGDDQRLELYWLEGYGGGIFLPFRDDTSGKETYGAGRYLLDSVKGADLGMAGDQLILDFNFSYNPSCSYDPQWLCPLAPPENRIDAEVRAGEMTP